MIPTLLEQMYYTYPVQSNDPPRGICCQQSLSSLAPAGDKVKVLEQLVLLVADVASFPRRRQNSLLHRELLVEVAHVLRMTLRTKNEHASHGTSFSTTRVSWRQKDNAILDFNEARNDE